jgi:hypothetical protein
MGVFIEVAAIVTLVVIKLSAFRRRIPFAGQCTSIPAKPQGETKALIANGIAHEIDILPQCAFAVVFEPNRQVTIVTPWELAE